MTYWFVVRETKHDDGVRVGVSQGSGDLIYVYKPGDELRFADERSALSFVRACHAYPAGLPVYENMVASFRAVKVEDG